MQRSRTVSALLAVALLLTPAVAGANDSSMGGAGGAVTPIGSSEDGPPR